MMKNGQRGVSDSVVTVLLILHTFGDNLMNAGNLRDDNVLDYAHEYVRLVTPKERRSRAGCAVVVIFFLAEGALLLFSFGQSLIAKNVIPFALASLWYFFASKDVLVYNGKIKIFISGDNVIIRVLLRAPELMQRSSPSRFNITVPIHTIADVSVKSIRNLKMADASISVLDDAGMFKRGICNMKMPFFSKFPYRYVFVLHLPPLPEGKFVYIQPQNGKAILIEFDNAENFVAAFMQSKYFDKRNSD